MPEKEDSNEGAQPETPQQDQPVEPTPDKPIDLSSFVTRGKPVEVDPDTIKIDLSATLTASEPQEGSSKKLSD
ncbi:hypothetical protein KAT84_04950 [Candidatus Bipolaricaulota bacterium]|nr:hypothetical protein [Candidatus Bipolaricaulota bacterium]